MTCPLQNWRSLMKTFMVIFWQLVEFHQASLPTLHFRPSLQVVHLLFSLLCFSLDAHIISSIFVKDLLAGWLSALTQTPFRKLPIESCLATCPSPSYPSLKKKKEKPRVQSSGLLLIWKWIRREKLWLIWFGDKGERKANADFVTQP